MLSEDSLSVTQMLFLANLEIHNILFRWFRKIHSNDEDGHRKRFHFDVHQSERALHRSHSTSGNSKHLWESNQKLIQAFSRNFKVFFDAFWRSWTKLVFVVQESFAILQVEMIRHGLVRLSLLQCSTVVLSAFRRSSHLRCWEFRTRWFNNLDLGLYTFSWFRLYWRQFSITRSVLRSIYSITI